MTNRAAVEGDNCHRKVHEAYCSQEMLELRSNAERINLTADWRCWRQMRYGTLVWLPWHGWGRVWLPDGSHSTVSPFSGCCLTRRKERPALTNGAMTCQTLKRRQLEN